MMSISIEETRNYIDLRTEILLIRFLTLMQVQDTNTITYYQIQAFYHMIPYISNAGKKTEKCIKKLLSYFER